MSECHTGGPDLLATRSAFASRRLLSVSSGESADEFEDLPACGQHVGHAVGFSEMLLELDLRHANPPTSIELALSAMPLP